MSDTPPATTSIVPTANPVARSYAWRLLMLVPALILMAIGGLAYFRTEEPNVANGVRLTTKGDLAGQVRDAYDSVDPRTADLYLVLIQRDGQRTKLKPFDDTPIGDGLTWSLESPLPRVSIASAEVWDSNTLMKDKQLDHMSFNAEGLAAGQTFRLSLLSPPPPEAARWPLPVFSVGATLAIVVLLRFVWDQAI